MTLDFHRQVFQSLYEKDGLVVMAKGLGIRHVILAFLKLYSDSDHLVLYLDPINDSLQESYVYFTEQLLAFGINYAHLPTLINTEHTGSKVNMYKKGGFYFAPASIFILDFLTKRLPSHLITGIIVNNAHKLTDLSCETMLIRLFKQSNKDGFVKAFSNDAPSLVGELSKVHRILKYLHVNALYLWPRFHSSISQILDSHQPKLIELSIHQTPSMESIEKALLSTIASAVQSLQRNNSKLSGGQAFSMEDSLFNSFDAMLHQQLKPMWGDISKQSKQTIANIKVLRTLSNSLIAYDCVTFLKLLESIALTEVEDDDSWIHTEIAQTLFRNARERVYIQSKLNIQSPPKKQKLDANNNNGDNDDNNNDNDKDKNNNNNNNNNNQSQQKQQPQQIYKRELVLEENPKWNLLLQVLEEIEEMNMKLDEPENVLVIVKDERTCQQLQDYLNFGGYDMLLNRYDRMYPPDRPTTMPPQYQQRYKNNGHSSSRSGNGGHRFSNKSKQINQANRKQKISETNYRKKVDKDNNNSLFSMGVSVVSNGGNMFIPNPKIISSIPGLDIDDFDEDELTDFYGILPSPHIVIHPMDHSLSILNELRPRFIVIYDIEISITRQIEVYQAENPDIQIAVYLLFYGESTEERKYLTVLKREQSSFEKLIREKTNLVIDTSTHVSHEEAYKLLDAEASTRIDSRFGGLRRALVPSKNPCVIIDSHEFKSSLPVALNGAGFEIIPKRLTVADYVITPIHAAERKSVPDLIGSFQSGRLYAQIEAMSRVYRNPILLIEFDLQQPFISLISPEEMNFTTFPKFTLSSKLILLAQAFPRMRIIWSRSAHSTVNIFRRIKELLPEPDPQNIDEITEDATDDVEYNYAPQDVVRKLPGITDANVKRVMNGVRDLHELSQQTLEQMVALLGSEDDGKELYNFFNFTVPTTNINSSSTSGSFSNSKNYYSTKRKSY